MKDWYFYQEKGKTVGPLNVDDIKGRIKEGRIRVFDLIYKDGEPTWKMALEHDSLRLEFKSTALSDLKERPWVCLRRKEPESLEFITVGPFTTDEIRSNLKSGELSYSDYAWKDDLSEWKRIGALEEFNRRVRGGAATVPPVPSVPEDSSVNLLKNVVELRRPRADFTESPPLVERRDPYSRPSANLPPIPPKSSTSIPVPPVANPVRETTGKIPLPPAGYQTAPARSHERKERKRTKPLFDWSLVAILTLVLTGAVLIISRFVLPHAEDTAEQAMPARNTEVLTPPAKREPPPAHVPPAREAMKKEMEEPKMAETAPPPPEPEKEAEEKTPAKPIVHRDPTGLHLAVQSGSPPRIEIRTDASADYSMYVQIIAPAGQVLEGGSFYRFMRLHPNDDGRKAVALPPIKFPPGKYILRAEVGDFKKEAKFSVGTSDPSYHSALNRQRKTWAYAIWKERLALFKLAETLEKQVEAGKFTGHGWEPLINLKRGAGGKYLMFDDWWELHNIAKDAKSGVSPGVVNRAIHERERLASFSVWK